MRAAYELFSRNGVRAVGIDTIIDEASVAKMTLYRNFSSKDELVLDFLRRREQLWTDSWLRAEVDLRASDPVGRLLAIFELFDEWFREPDFSGCAFITTMVEFADRSSPVRQACLEHLAYVRAFLRQLAVDAELPDPDAFARQWHLLMKGSIVAATEGDDRAARQARELGLLLLRSHGLACRPADG